MKKPSKTDHGKTKTLQKLSETVFDLEVSKGHLAWKVTDIVRKSKVSRSLVYRYLGSSKKEMLTTALRNFTSEFFGFDTSKDSLTFLEHLMEARERIQKKPEALLFYLKWRAKESWIQKEFIAVEAKFQQDLKKTFPKLSDLQIQGTHAWLFGLVTAPFLNPEQSAQIWTEMVKW